MNSNEELITRFYTAFANKDFKGMQQCYADNVEFNDNAFPGLTGKQPKAMWHMLVGSSKDMQLTFSDVKADENTGSANWVATYTFSLTGNKVINRIHANFEFKNGLIVKHTDTFDFYKWSSQAFGFKGMLLGWTPFFKDKIQGFTRERLKSFIDKNAVYQ